MDGYIGEIRHFAAGFAPRNWAYCNGQTIAIQSNTALFSLIGTTYGGNGTSNFRLPDLGGRVVNGAGALSGGSSIYTRGQMGGENSHNIILSELASHTHGSTTTVSVPCYGDDGDVATPDGNTLAAKPNMYSSVAGDDNMKPISFTVNLAPTGLGQPISIMQPTIGMNYIICLYGTFPARS